MSVSGTSGTGSFSKVSSDYITEEELKMYGIETIYLSCDDNNKTLFIYHLDNNGRYSYNATGLDINNLIRQHINKYCIREIRREKLERLKIIN
jgi:hypothetical protein